MNDLDTMSAIAFIIGVSSKLRYAQPLRDNVRRYDHGEAGVYK